MTPRIDRLGGRWMLATALAIVAACTSAEDGEDKPCSVLPTPTLSEADACDPARTTFSLGSKNPYYPLFPGSLVVLEGNDEGEVVRVERRVLPDTEVVAGVTTHVLEAKELKNEKLYEVARNFYVEAANGTVCYFGEDVTFYDPSGNVANHDGSWRAGDRGAKPGIIMPAQPAPGQLYFQEAAPGVAQDMGRVASVGGTMTLGGKVYDNVVTIKDTNPLEACGREEDKHYVPSVGEAGDTVKTLRESLPGTAPSL